MPRFTPKRYEQILPQMIARVVTRSDMSDVADSAAVKHVLAAAARSDDEQYYQMSLLLQLFSIDTAQGEDLDERAKDIQPAVVSRRQATKSTGVVVFSRVGTTGTVSIPIGTKVKTSDGVIFVTTSVGTITPTSPEKIFGHGVGRDSNDVAVVADQPGTSGNVVATTIIKFDTKPAGVDEVTNQTAIINGLDKETDDAFRNRLKNYVASLARCTLDALEVGVIGQQDPTTGQTILFAKTVEDIIDRGDVVLYIDDGTGAAEAVDTVTGENVTEGLQGPPPDSAVGGEERLYLNEYPIKEVDPITVTSSTRGALTINVDYYLNPASGQINFDPPLVTAEVITASYTHYVGLIKLAQTIVDGDPNDRITYPGLRAAGVLVRVRTPQILLQTVTAVITTAEGYEFTTTRDAVVQAVKDYINNLSISDDVIRNKLIAQMMGVPGVINVLVSSPAADIAILDDQLARTQTANITIT
jgi:uncharacterized phage protein gp47/JayE